ncbi:hypothetical protein DY000_02010645 [Brassica cretica]|uniref:WRKY domain-containing protein n=1 Tax=Brassica cretica TaxID=69181 RepID=A0ABQ7C0S3_BRACR|nr:hypothetical protein DY000_02010645 [Brassica cretica]
MTSYSTSQLIFTIAPPSPVAIIGPPEVVESSGGDHATMMISKYGLPHQRIDVDQAPEDHNIIDVLNVEPSSPKRREDEVSNIIGTLRAGRYNEGVIIQMESEENNLDDGYSWKKYGQRLIMGNQNTRSYYKCTFSGCDVKKHVERRADNAKSLVITYYGNHEHDAPVKRRKCYSLKKRPGSSMSYYKCTFSGCDVKKHVERRADNAKSLVITYYGNHEHDAPVKRRKCYSLKKRPGSSMFQDASNRTPRVNSSEGETV